MKKLLFVIIALLLLSAVGNEPTKQTDEAVQAKKCREAYPISWVDVCSNY
jgi:hypothetical protein